MSTRKSRIVRSLRTVIVPGISTKTINRVLISEVLTVLRSKTFIKSWLLIIVTTLTRNYKLLFYLTYRKP
ncbi:hypothetical protein HanIR_Chr16g0837871 [Helianthus annuus]|nr:hypothetical protein HanIR_Chr16g0837871 [Helianthus annuus]